MDSTRPPSTDPGQPVLPTAGGTRSFSIAKLIGGLFLAAQAIFIVQTHYTADSPRMLTPVEGLTRYELHATLDQRPLTATEIHDRYGLPARSDIGLTVEAVQSVVKYWEQPIPLSRAVMVRLHTRAVNGTEDYWLWPQE